MAIITKLEELMKKRGYSIAKLSEEIGISPVNISKIKNGHVSAIRFSTLDSLCRVLECQPQDILVYQERENDKKKVIPLFLDYSGTTDLLLRSGAENVKDFFDSIIDLQNKTRSEVQIIMVTGSSKESAKSKFKLLSDLATNYGLEELFTGVVAEYSGHYITKEDSSQLVSIDKRILDKTKEIEKLTKEYGGEISPSVSSFYNVLFEDISRIKLSEFGEKIDAIMEDGDKNNPISTTTYYDEYGKECDIKPKGISKANAVRMIVERLRKKYNIPFVIIGGDDKREDLIMYTENTDRFKKMGLNSVFIAPSNIGKISNYDKNIIVGKWENATGIVDTIKQLTGRVREREDGAIEI